jgi:hypothetical protein
VRPTVVAFLLLDLVCVRGLVSAPQREAGAELELTVHLDQSYRRVDLGLLSSDGGTRFTQRVSFPDGGMAVIRSRTWHQGAGVYAVSMSFQRSDGGEDVQTTPFEMRADDVRAAGYATFFDFLGHPQLSLDVIERKPPGLRLERTSEISREGLATYVLINDTGRELFPGYANLMLERRDADAWRGLSEGWCVGPEHGPLNPTARLGLNVATGVCVSNALAPGRYRHSIRIHTIEPAPACETYDDPSEVTRSIEVTGEFDERSIGNFAGHAFSDVPSAALRVGMMSSAAAGFSAQVIGPDGGSACVCPNTLVARERLRAVAGIGGPCLTDNPDASTIVCEPLGSRSRGLGDHPPFGNPWDLE